MIPFDEFCRLSFDKLLEIRDLSLSTPTSGIRCPSLIGIASSVYKCRVDFFPVKDATSSESVQIG